MKGDYFQDQINKDGFCFVAEVSNNHLGDFGRYIRLIEEASKCGAHAVKIQTYTPESLLAPGRFCDVITEGPWSGQSYFDLYTSICAPIEWTDKLFEFARNKNIFLFSTPFSTKDISILESVNCPAYKVSSFEFTDLTLWDQLAGLGKPLLASTGISTDSEIKLVFANQVYRKNLSVLFNCVSAYPSNLSMLNLNKFDVLSLYGCKLGLSDHSLDVNSCIFSFARGVRVFEKHFTLSRSDGGPDSLFSLEPNELVSHLKVLRDCFAAQVGSQILTLEGMSHGRVVYAKSAIKKGECFAMGNVSCFRPYHSDAVSSLYVKDLLDKASKHSYDIGDIILKEELGLG